MKLCQNPIVRSYKDQKYLKQAVLTRRRWGRSPALLDLLDRLLDVEKGTSVDLGEGGQKWIFGGPKLRIPHSWSIYDLLGPISPGCPTLRSFGSGDLEKRICWNEEMSQDDECVVFSLGSNNEFEFEQDIAKQTPCKFEVFDCTIAGRVPTDIDARTTYHDVCIAGKAFVDDKGREYKTWTQLVEMSNMPTYLKMDVEGFEFPAIRSMLGDGSKRPKYLPHQIALEIHLWSYYALPHRVRMAGEIMEFSKYMFEVGGYMLVDRRDNDQCAHCSELVFARIDCTGQTYWK